MHIGVETANDRQYFVSQGLVKGLNQDQIAIAVDVQSRGAFDATVKKTVAVSLFQFELADQSAAMCQGVGEEVGQGRGVRQSELTGRV